MEQAALKNTGLIDSTDEVSIVFLLTCYFLSYHYYLNLASIRYNSFSVLFLQEEVDVEQTDA